MSWLSEWVIKFNGPSGDIRQQGPYKCPDWLTSLWWLQMPCCKMTGRHYMRTSVPEDCVIQLLIHAWDTCLWHQSPHISGLSSLSTMLTPLSPSWNMKKYMLMGIYFVLNMIRPPLNSELPRQYFIFIIFIRDQTRCKLTTRSLMIQLATTGSAELSFTLRKVGRSVTYFFFVICGFVFSQW